ncbi:unnamed protein product [Meganyctiphanes norvegica]|uniref:C2H2-type domain-containing protein n=1 Tax=Meganyctiphanes norvegica TaxID=48144 RepID=A0AAV2SXG9_MEGNR
MKQHQYNICITRPGLKCNMLIHIRVHMEEKPYSCNRCEILLGHNSMKVDAQGKHKVVKPYQYCNETVCTLIYNRKKQFQRNTLSYKPPESNMPLSCTECDLDFGHLFCDKHNELLAEQSSPCISILCIYRHMYNITICNVIYQRRTQFSEIENKSCYHNIRFIVIHIYFRIHEKLFSCSCLGMLQYIEDKWYYYILMKIYKGTKPYQCNSVILYMYLFTREKPYQSSTLYHKTHCTDIWKLFSYNECYTYIVWPLYYNKECESLYGTNSHYSRYLLTLKWS